jgi:hypothetical protein
MNAVQITDPAEIAAVASNEIDGETFSDGECWADVASLARWRNRMPIAALEASGEGTTQTI